MDYEILKQLKASREAKVRSVVGTAKHAEFDRDKAARIAMQPYYQQPDMKPTFDPRPQTLGDRFNEIGPRSGYANDLADSDWKSAPAESGERKPAFDRMQSKSKHGIAKRAPPLPDNPAEEGPGHRED